MKEDVKLFEVVIKRTHTNGKDHNITLKKEIKCKSIAKVDNLLDKKHKIYPVKLRKNNEDVKNTARMKGNVVYLDTDGELALEKIINSIMSHGAIAIFVNTDHLSQMNVPTCFLRKEEFQLLADGKGLREAYFKELDELCGSMTASDFKLLEGKDMAKSEVFNKDRLSANSVKESSSKSLTPEVLPREKRNCKQSNSAKNQVLIEEVDNGIKACFRTKNVDNDSQLKNDSIMHVKDGNEVEKNSYASIVNGTQNGTVLKKSEDIAYKDSDKKLDCDKVTKDNHPLSNIRRYLDESCGSMTASDFKLLEDMEKSEVFNKDRLSTNSVKEAAAISRRLQVLPKEKSICKQSYLVEVVIKGTHTNGKDYNITLKKEIKCKSIAKVDKLVGNKYKLHRVKLRQNETIKISNQMKGNAVYLDTKGKSAPEKIINSIMSHGAIAIFVNTDHLSPMNIPTCFLEKEEFQLLVEGSGLREAYFKELDESCGSMTASDFKLLEGKDMAKSEVFNKNRLSANSVTQNGHPFANFVEMSSQYFKKWRQPDAELKKDIINLLKRDYQWTKDNHSSYTLAKQILKRALSSNQKDVEIREFAKQMYETVNRKSFVLDPLFLAFIFLICEEVGEKKMNSIVETVKNSIVSMPMNEKFEKVYDIDQGSTRALSHFSKLILQKCCRQCSDQEVVYKLAFVLVHHCNEDQFRVWMTICDIVTPTTFRAWDLIFSDSMIVISLELYVQTSLYSFNKVMCRIVEDTTHDEFGTGKLKLYEKVAEKLGELIMGIGYSDNDVYQIIRLLPHFEIGVHKYFNMEYIISKLVKSCSYMKRNDFYMLNDISRRIDPSHAYYDIFRCDIMNAITNDLRCYYMLPKLDDVMFIWKSCLRYILNETAFISAIKNYFRSIILRRNDRAVKLITFLESFFRYLAEQDIKSVHYLSQELLLNVLSEKKSFQVTSIFDLALKKEFFHYDGFEGVTVLVANLFITKEYVRYIDYNDLASIKIVEYDFKEGTLMKCLISELKSIHRELYTNVKDAFPLYEKLKKQQVLHDSIVSSILRDVILEALNRWVVQSFLDLLKEETRILEILSDICTKYKPDILHDYKEKYEIWLSSHFDENMPIDTLEKSIHYYEKKKRIVLGLIIGDTLPSELDLKHKLSEFDECCSLITKDFMLNISVVESTPQTILNVFKGYGYCEKSDSSTNIMLIECGKISSMTYYKKQAKSIKEKYSVSSIQELQRKLFSFIETNKNEIAAANFFLKHDSTLFKRYLNIGASESLSIERFLQNTSQAILALHSMFSLDERCTFQEISSAFESLDSDYDNLSKEVEVIFSCAQLHLRVIDKENFTLAILFIDFSRKISHIINYCTQCKHSFMDDESFKNLQKVERSLNYDTKNFEQWSMNEILEWMKDFHNCFFPDCEPIDFKMSTNLKAIFPLLDLLNYLSSCIDVWILAKEMQWLCKDGIQQFQQEYENITNILLFAPSESFEMKVLDSLDPVVKLLCMMYSLTSMQYFHEFINAFNKEQYKEILCREYVQKAKMNLEIVQENVCSIKEWFIDGLDEMASIFAKFDLVWSEGKYVIERSILCLEYKSHESSKKDVTNNSMLLRGNDLGDFMQKLGFVRHEIDEKSIRLKSFVEQYQLLQKLSENYSYCTSFGFRSELLCTFEYKANNSKAKAETLYIESIKVRKECDMWLRNVRCENPSSLLFWKEELQHLYDNFKDFALSNSVESKISLFSLLGQKLVSSTEDKSTYEKKLQETFDQCLEENLVPYDSNEDNWFQSISQYVERSHASIGSPRYCDENDESRNRGLHLHYLNYDGFFNEGKLLILKQIYEVRKIPLVCFSLFPKNIVCVNITKICLNAQVKHPEEFELLDASYAIAKERLLCFLERVIAFPQSIFVVSNVEALSVENQEMILVYLSKNTLIEKSNLHFIQCAESVVQHSPLLQKRTWSLNDVKKSRFSFQDIMKKKSLISMYVDRIIIISSDRNGSGKTKFINEKIKNPSFTININERSSLISMIKTLKRKFKNSKSSNVVHFSLMTSLDSKYSALLKDLNRFFQSLLLTGVVTDPMTFESFSLEARNWTFYIELQDPADSNIESVKNSLLAYMPLLAYCATFESPPSVFDIDQKARRVCTYLRAFNNGTINRKFQPAKKLIIFVIDKSGSMAGWQIHSAIDNAIKIFHSHVKNDDVSMMFAL